MGHISAARHSNLCAQLRQQIVLWSDMGTDQDEIFQYLNDIVLQENLFKKYKAKLTEIKELANQYQLIEEMNKKKFRKKYLELKKAKRFKTGKRTIFQGQ